jgi:hypothetical protein
MATLGKDCHVILTHPLVNSGQPCGFVLEEVDHQRGAPFTMQREVDSDGKVYVRLFFDVLLADNLLNPDGSRHARSRAELYTLLTGYLAQREGITVQTGMGVLSNIGALGHCATETHYPGVSLAACQFNNTGVYYPPADPGLYFNSAWDGTLTWGGSFWR